jgi:acyl-CoA thioesterase I
MLLRDSGFMAATNKRPISSGCPCGPLAIAPHFARRCSRDVLRLPKPCGHPSGEQPLAEIDAEIDGGRPATMFISRDRGESRDRILSFFSKRWWLIKDTVCPAARIACMGAALLGVFLGASLGNFPESAHAQTEMSTAETCLAANSNLSLGTRLPRTEARLKSGEPLKIVAMGSSSTVGLWVLSSSATYPEVMRRELVRLQPNARIDIVNSGRVGDTIPDNLARFERDVFAFGPDLVVWQLGTNDVAWGGHPDDQLSNKVVQGVRALKASGADVILMDLQFSPMVLASSYYSKMQAIVSEVAQQESVGLFSRFALMHNSIDAGVPQGALVSFDGLHNSAEGYDCIGRALARAIFASTRPIELRGASIKRTESHPRRTAPAHSQ